jgi:predicted nucleic acid-binding protein
MSANVLLDTGPFVAFLSQRDANHDWAVAQFATLDLPFATCEPVLTESCFIAARNGLSPARVLDIVARGVARVELQIDAELNAIRELMTRYANVPMSLADACLVRLAEVTGLPICTLDSDFLIYRAHGRDALDLIMPPRARGLHEP